MIDLKLYKKDNTPICTLEGTRLISDMNDEEFNEISWRLPCKLVRLLAAAERLLDPDLCQGVEVEDREIGAVIQVAKEIAQELYDRLGAFHQHVSIFDGELPQEAFGKYSELIRGEIEEPLAP